MIRISYVTKLLYTNTKIKIVVVHLFNLTTICARKGNIYIKNEYYVIVSTTTGYSFCTRIYFSLTPSFYIAKEKTSMHHLG